MVHWRLSRARFARLGRLALLACVPGCGEAPRDVGVSVCTSPDACADPPPSTDISGEGSGDAGAAGANGGAAAPSGGSAPATSGPHFPGSGNGHRPLTAGCGPQTATQCTGSCEQGVGAVSTEVLRPPATLCFAGEGDPTPDDPAVVIEQVIERAGDRAYVHVRVTFDPAFTDNTYGAGSCCGWPEKRGHHFGDLTRSDHTELLLTDTSGSTAMHFKLDLVSEKASAACGFGTLGVSGGDGSVLAGDPEHVLAVATSADRNLNGCGYCESAACAPSGDCTIDSPPTDADFRAAPETPAWDYRQVYEAWIDTAAFGDLGFGQAYVTYTHSSPAKAAGETVTVEPTPCPPEWDDPYCPPDVIREGGNCFSGPPDAGEPECPPNQQVYLISEGASLCTPIPFTNNPGMDPCPAGYALDLASEGRYCVPSE